MITAARAAAALAALTGGLTIVEYATGAGLGVDELLFRHDTARVATEVPGRMAPNTATALLIGGLALVLLGIAALLARPARGPAGLLMNTGTTGALGRRLFATVLVVPPLLGRLVLAGEDAALFGTRLGTALLVCGHVAVFTAIIFSVLVVGRLSV
ncbi:hypothetical protein ACWGI9_00050 [Streptomyces sp. NPDC054833]